MKESGCEVPSYMLTVKKTPKKKRKELERSAPKRDDIDTRPKYEILKKIRKRSKKHLENLDDKKTSQSKVVKKQKIKKDKQVNIKKMRVHGKNNK